MPREQWLPLKKPICREALDQVVWKDTGVSGIIYRQEAKAQERRG